jgi:Ca2+-transporting ATPase
MAFIPLLFGWPMAFFPVHIVFFQFVIDPACSIAFEAEPADDEIMRQPPRPPAGRLFSLPTVMLSVFQGAGVLLAVAAVYGYALLRGSEAEARAMAFTTIIFGNLALILAGRSRTRLIAATLTRVNAALWAIVGGTLAALVLVLYLPYFGRLFQLTALSPAALLTCLAAAFAGTLCFELCKYFWRGK